MRHTVKLAVVSAFMFVSGTNYAETQRVCDAWGHCKDVVVSTSCRDGIDQYTGQPCIYGTPGSHNPKPTEPGCRDGINQYTGRPC